MGVSDPTGRKALVTGGARGLGAGMAEALAQAGAAVVIGDIREDLGKATADTLRGSGATAGFVPLDVTDDASWEQAVPVVIDELGGLDIVVNNAGVEGLPEHDKLRVLTEQAAGVMSENPPRENTRINTSLDSVHASGPLGRAHCVIHGNSNYKQTGLLQAYAAYSLLQQPPHRVGFASGCQAFGHRELLGVLRSFGLVMQPNVTVQH